MYMQGSRKFCQRGSKFDNFFFVSVFKVDGGIEDSNTDLIWPPTARQRNAIEMAFCWCAD